MADMTDKIPSITKDIIKNYEFEVAQELGMSPKINSDKWACTSKLDKKDDKIIFRNNF